MIARRRRPGTSSRNSCKRLPPRSVASTDNPVRLPPGRARDATRPVPSGSAATAKTIGIVDVDCFAARTIGFAYVTMTSTLIRTNSAASSAARSLLPSAQRYSIIMLRPSIQPSSRNFCKNAVSHSPWPAGVPEPKKPMVGSFSSCCVLAASGQVATVPPISPMNSRRLMDFPRQRTSHVSTSASGRGCALRQIWVLDFRAGSRTAALHRRSRGGGTINMRHGAPAKPSAAEVPPRSAARKHDRRG